MALPSDDGITVPPSRPGDRANMRTIFCQSLEEASRRPNFIFLTGDLGYKALEPLRAALGERFINAGVAEQNMVSVGAGLARVGLRPWLYSIAPFIYARQGDRYLLYSVGPNLVDDHGLVTPLSRLDRSQSGDLVFGPGVDIWTSSPPLR